MDVLGVCVARQIQYEIVGHMQESKRQTKATTTTRWRESTANSCKYHGCNIYLLRFASQVAACRFPKIAVLLVVIVM